MDASSILNEAGMQTLAAIAAVGAGVIYIIKLLFEIAAREIQMWQDERNLKRKLDMERYVKLEEKKVALELERISQERIDCMSHPFWQEIHSHVTNEISFNVAPNKCKKLWALDYQRTTWLLFEQFGKEIIQHKLDSSREDCYTYLVRSIPKYEQLRIETLLMKGFDMKVIETFNEATAFLSREITAMLRNVWESNLYQTNHQRYYAFLDIMLFLAIENNEKVWHAIVNSNGKLKGLSYQGFTNE